jgi:hypothetical protein
MPRKMPVKTGRDPAQFGLFATPSEAMIALYPVADGFESRCLEGLSH